MIHAYDIVGLFGIAMIVAAYLLLQTGKLESQGLSYSLLNLFGALLVLYSICFAFNLSAFLVEAFWSVISLVGVARFFLRTRRSQGEQSGKA